MQIADTTDMVEMWLRVRGSETRIPMIAEIAWKATVQIDESERVLRILAPVKTWKPTARSAL
jgi:hypothetical protein